uniref:AlNc14C173G8069 protein n=2 Tax=Albugo laibachii Nc14 TaxID=890382 RepID=F0WNP8_9STRA|nr:AlNc14C173G8069 [Albugo laibachii Nc14]|eukprot:CCA22939.1 AlNc14C173G8069 [Albugo laibachii Nc14]
MQQCARMNYSYINIQLDQLHPECAILVLTLGLLVQLRLLNLNDLRAHLITLKALITLITIELVVLHNLQQLYMVAYQ